jgi:hypothetical protein
MNNEGTRFHIQAKPTSHINKLLFRLSSTPVENLCTAAQNKKFISQAQENDLKTIIKWLVQYILSIFYYTHILKIEYVMLYPSCLRIIMFKDKMHCCLTALCRGSQLLCVEGLVIYH